MACSHARPPGSRRPRTTGGDPEPRPGYGAAHAIPSENPVLGIRLGSRCARPGPPGVLVGMTQPPIQAEDLVKRYGTRIVVDAVSFRTQPGRVTALLGPNGAGKSTTLRMLLGLARPTSGTALVMGQPYRSLPNPARLCGVMIDANQAHPGRTGRAHLAALAAASGTPRTRIATVLDQVGLTGAARRRVGTYSLGMKQRLGLAAALLADPATIVLDEPTNGLDPDGITWLWHLLDDLAANGRTVLVSSHQLAEVAQVADDVVIIAQGRVRANAPLAQLTNPEQATTFASPDPIEAWHHALPGTRLERQPAGGWIAHGLAPAQIGAAATSHRLTLHHLASAGRSLADIYADLTHDHLDHTTETRP